MRFGAILADPPWAFHCWSEASVAPGSRASAHYATQGSDWLMGLPVASVAADDCVLFMWACWPLLPEALEVIKAWGFEYKTLAFSWVKVARGGAPMTGLGYWTRANTEPCLLATRRRPSRQARDVSQVIVTDDTGPVLACGRGRHSQKPDEQYTRIERLATGPYLELLHRPRHGLLEQRTGWTYLGNEVSGKDMRTDLHELARRIAGGRVA